MIVFNNPQLNSNEIRFNDPTFIADLGGLVVSSVNGGAPVIMGQSFSVAVDSLVGNPAFTIVATDGTTSYILNISHTGTGPYTMTVPDLTQVVEDAVQDIPVTSAAWSLSVMVTDDNDDSTASGAFTLNLPAGWDVTELDAVLAGSALAVAIGSAPVDTSQAWFPTANNANVFADGDIEGDADFDMKVWHADTGLLEDGTVLFEYSNTAPVTSPVTLSPVAEDSGALLITQAMLLVNASDGDSDPLTATSLAISAGSGSLIDNLDGTWSYTPAADDDTSVSFSYSVTDGVDAVAGSATLDLTPVNDAPTTSAVTLDPIAEDSGTLLITQAMLLVNAADAENDSLTAYNLAISSGSGSLVDNLDGTWDYTPAANDDSSVSFTYSITDGSLNTAATATLDITPANDPGTGAVTISGTTTEGQALSAVTDTIADVEGLGAFSYQWLRDDVDIAGATSSTYLLVTADVGTAISVRVSYTDGQGSAESFTSSPTATVAALPVEIPIVPVRLMVDTVDDANDVGFDIPEWTQFIDEEWPYSWDFSGQATARSTELESITHESVGQALLTVVSEQISGDTSLFVVTGEEPGVGILKTTCTYTNQQDRVRYIKIKVKDSGLMY